MLIQRIEFYYLHIDTQMAGYLCVEKVKKKKKGLLRFTEHLVNVLGFNF